MSNKTLFLAAFLASIACIAGEAAEVQIIEKPLDQLPKVELSPRGELALSMKPEKWKHAETNNFVLHFRRVTEAKKVARETEAYAEFLIEFLKSEPPATANKSNVFVFEDDEEWHAFANEAGVPPWTASFAIGEDLYLNVRESSQGRFNSITLAHETAHAVVSRLFPGTRLPLWLNEGFAEYVAGVAVAARKGQYTKGNQQRLELADMSVEELQSLTRYPDDPVKVTRLYQSSEKVVRFLVDKHGRERFAAMIQLMVTGSDFATAFLERYGDLYPDLPALQKKINAYRK